MVEGDGRTPASLSVDPVDSVPDLLLCQPSFGRDSRNGHGGEEGDGGSSSILAQTGPTSEMDPSHPYPYYVTDPPVAGLDSADRSHSGPISHLSAAIQQQEHQRQGYYALPPPGTRPSQLPALHDPPDSRCVVLERRPPVLNATVGGRVAKVAPMPPIVPSPSSISSSPPVRLEPGGASPTLSPGTRPGSPPQASRATSPPCQPVNTKKLSAAEIQRIRINQASDYYRKQREAQNERERLRVVEQEQKQREIQLEQQRILERRRNANSHPVSNHRSQHPAVTPVNVPSSNGLTTHSTSANIHGPPHGPLVVNRDREEGISYSGYQASGFHSTNASHPYPNPAYSGHAAQAAHSSNPPPPPVMTSGVTNQPRSNIDLGAVVQSTIVNNVSKEFTQHWIIVGQDMRTLLLDFNGSFTLLIPNVENGQAFRVNSTSMEIQSRSLSNGQKLTFMKFQFRDPPTEIVAPVLQDKNMGYKVLKQNSACVFIGRILDDIRPNNAQVPSSSSSSSIAQASTSFQPTSAPLASYAPPVPPPPPPSVSPLLPSHCSSATFNNLGPIIRQVSETVYGGHEAELLIAPPPQQIEFAPQSGEPMDNGLAFYPEPTKVTTLPNSALSEQINLTALGSTKPSMPFVLGESPGQANFNTVVVQPPQFPMTSNQFQNQSLMTSQGHLTSQQPPSTNSGERPQEPMKIILSPKTLPSAASVLGDQPKHPESSNAVFPDPGLGSQPLPSVDLTNVYPALKDEERQKLTRCRFCERTFTFVSELLVHMKVHVLDVSKVAEMSLKMWVQGRRLKCDVCKNKTSYTLDYAKHKDDHPILGLACLQCTIPVKSPLELALHMEKDHPTQIFQVTNQFKTGNSETSDNVTSQTLTSQIVTCETPAVLGKNAEKSHSGSPKKSDLEREFGNSVSNDPPEKLEQPPKILSSPVDPCALPFPPAPAPAPAPAPPPPPPPCPHSLSSGIADPPPPSPSHTIATPPMSPTCPPRSSWEQSAKEQQEDSQLQSPQTIAAQTQNTEPLEPQSSIETNSSLLETMALNAHREQDLEASRIIDDLAQHLGEEILEQRPPRSTPETSPVFSEINLRNKDIGDTICPTEKLPSPSHPSIGSEEFQAEGSLSNASAVPDFTSVESNVPNLDANCELAMPNLSAVKSGISHFDDVDSDLPDFNSVIQESCHSTETIETAPFEDPFQPIKVEEDTNNSSNKTIKLTETTSTKVETSDDVEHGVDQQNSTEKISSEKLTTEDEDFELKLSEDSDSDNEPPERHVCEICGDEFATPTSLKIHRTKCKNNEERLRCSVCLDCFMSTTSLNMHLTMCKKKMKMKNLDDDSALPTPSPPPPISNKSSVIHQKEECQLKQRNLNDEDQDPSIDKTKSVIGSRDRDEECGKLFSSQNPTPLSPIASSSSPPLAVSPSALPNAKTATNPTQSSFLDSICKIDKKLLSKDPKVAEPLCESTREKKSAKVRKKMEKHHPKSMLKNNSPLSLSLASSSSPSKDDTLAQHKEQGDVIPKINGDEESELFQDLNYDTILFENSKGIKLRLKKQPVGVQVNLQSSDETINVQKQEIQCEKKEKPWRPSELSPYQKQKKVLARKKYSENQVRCKPKIETKKTVAPLKLSILMGKKFTPEVQKEQPPPKGLITPREEPLKLKISLKRPNGHSMPVVKPHKLRIRNQVIKSTDAPVRLKISKQSCSTQHDRVQLNHVHSSAEDENTFMPVVSPILTKHHPTTSEKPARIPKLILRTSSFPGKDSFSSSKKTSLSDLQEITDSRSQYSMMVHIRSERRGRHSRSSPPKRVDSLANHLLALSCQVRLHPMVWEHISPHEVHPSQLKNVFRLCPMDMCLLEQNRVSTQPKKTTNLGCNPVLRPKRCLEKRPNKLDCRDNPPLNDQKGQPLSSVLAKIKYHPPPSSDDENLSSNVTNFGGDYRANEDSVANFHLNNECDGGVDGDVSSNENDDVPSESVTTRLFSAFKVITSLEETREIVQDVLHDLVSQISLDSPTLSAGVESPHSNSAKFECFRVPNGPSIINGKRQPLKRSGSGLDRSDYTKRRKRRRKLVDKLIIRTLRSPSTSTDEDSNIDHPDSTKKVCSSILNDLVSTVVAREPRMIIPALILRRPPRTMEPIECNKIVPPLKIKLSDNGSAAKSTSSCVESSNASVIEITANHSTAKRKGPTLQNPFTATQMTRPNHRGQNKSSGSSKLAKPGPKSVKIKKLLKITNKPLPPVSCLKKDAHEREVIAKAIDEIAQMDLDSAQRPPFNSKLEKVPIKRPPPPPPIPPNSVIISDDSNKRPKLGLTKREMWICDTEQPNVSPMLLPMSPPVFAKKSRVSPSMSPAPHRIDLPLCPSPSRTIQPPFVARKSGYPPPSPVSSTYATCGDDSDPSSSSERNVSEILWSKESFGINPEAYSVIDHLFENEVQKLASSITSSSEEPEDESEVPAESTPDPSDATNWMPQILLDLISKVMDRVVTPPSGSEQTETIEMEIQQIVLNVADEAVSRANPLTIDFQELSNYKLAKKYSDSRCLPQEFDYDSDLGRSEAASSEIDEFPRGNTCNNQSHSVVCNEICPSLSTIPSTNAESPLSKSSTLSPPKKKGVSSSRGAFSRKSYVKRRRKRANQVASKAPFDQLLSNTRRKYGMAKVPPNRQQPKPPPSSSPTKPDIAPSMITDEFLLLECSEDSSNCSLYEDQAKSTPSPTPSLTFDPPGMFVDDEFSPVNSNSDPKESDFEDDKLTEENEGIRYQSLPEAKKSLLKSGVVPSRPIQTRMKKRTLRGSTKL